MLQKTAYAPLTLRLRLRLRAPVNGSPGHGEYRGQRWGVLRQTQGRRTWASLGEAVFRQILQGGALRATILQRGRSQFPYPLKGGRQQSLRTVLGGGPSGPPPLLTSTSLGCRSQCRCGTWGKGGNLGGLFGGTLLSLFVARRCLTKFFSGEMVGDKIVLAQRNFVTRPPPPRKFSHGVCGRIETA